MRRFTFVVCLASLLALTAAARAAEVNARRALNTTLPELRFDSISLNDALDFIRDVSGTNIHVNWKALEEAGVGKDAVVNIRLRSVSMRKVLTLVLAEAGSGNLLTYYLDENVIEVTTRELADKQMFTKIYPVDDLIMEVPDFVGEKLTLQGSSGGRGGGGGSGGGQLLSGGGSGNNANATKSRAERAQDLIDTIQSIVQPDVWNVNGGMSAIRFWNGSLIVTAPRSVHEALGVYID